MNSFNSDIYRNNNNDLKNFNDTELLNHFNNYGKNENRIYSIRQYLEEIYSFNVNIYRENNKDLEKLTDNELFKHFYDNRKKEQRIHSINQAQAQIQRMTGTTLRQTINKILYNTPKCDDMAIGFVFFNPCNSNRLLMNYLYTVNKLRLSSIPYYTLELVFNNPEIPEAIHIKGEDIMFQKERLCYLLEKHIPEKYTKLLFLDCDIVFGNLNWYDDTSILLDKYEVVHPYTICNRLDITYNKSIISDISGLIKTNGCPGFGFAFQRMFYNKFPPYQYAIVGGGDSFYISWLYKDTNRVSHVVDNLKCNAFTNTFKINEDTKFLFSNTPGSIYHLYHGPPCKRQQDERYSILKNISDIRDILVIEENKPFIFKDKSFNDKIKRYLLDREDDES